MKPGAVHSVQWWPRRDLADRYRAEHQERVTDGALLQPLEPGELGHRRELVAGGERATGDCLPEPAGRLFPFHLSVRLVRPQVGNVAVLSERLAGAREVAPLLQACVEVVQQRARTLRTSLIPSAGSMVRRM